MLELISKVYRREKLESILPSANLKGHFSSWEEEKNRA
jgi:hypothetical protein